ncbi:MAG: hypothetical protein RBQ87_07655, partial [Candidatus Cloacimonadaceae bacterium]|nr:hypothetical protein [Candidatus Cloacimonadaceae bacterium]
TLGTRNAYLYISNNAINNPPSTQNNHLMIPITLNVTEPSGAVEAPQNLIIAKDPGLVSLAWDEVDNANSYQVYGCETLAGTFILVGSVTDAYIELTDADLAAVGLDSRAFFYVKANTDSRTAPQVKRK